MTRRLLIRPEAEADLVEARQWYEARRQGLGDDFLLCVDAKLATIQRHPALFPIVRKNVRRAPLRRFPYGVFYIAEERTIAVVAVFHLARDPARWQARVDRTPDERL